VAPATLLLRVQAERLLRLLLLLLLLLLLHMMRTATTAPPPTPWVKPSAEDCIMKQWGAWKDCTRTCGTGFQTRARAPLRQDKWGGAPTVPVVLRVAHVQHRHVPRRHQTSEAAHHRRGAAKKK